MDDLCDANAGRIVQALVICTNRMHNSVRYLDTVRLTNAMMDDAIECFALMNKEKIMKSWSPWAMLAVQFWADVTAMKNWEAG